MKVFSKCNKYCYLMESSWKMKYTLAKYGIENQSVIYIQSEGQ